MFTNSQVIIVLLIILISLQLFQLFFKNCATGKENFDPSDYKSVNYNTPMMRCDGNTGMLNKKCMVKSTAPTVKQICNSKLNLTDGPNYNTPEGEAVQPDIKGAPQIKIEDHADDDNSLLQLINENESEKVQDVQSVGNLEN